MGEYPVNDVCTGVVGVPSPKDENVTLTHVNKGGRPQGSSNLRSKQPSSIAQRLKAAGVDWVVDFADAIKHNRRERIAMWLRLLPYLITTSSRTRVKKWKGKASRAALIALDVLEGKK